MYIAKKEKKKKAILSDLSKKRECLLGFDMA